MAGHSIDNRRSYPLPGTAIGDTYQRRGGLGSRNRTCYGEHCGDTSGTAVPETQEKAQHHNSGSLGAGRWCSPWCWWLSAVTECAVAACRQTAWPLQAAVALHRDRSRCACQAVLNTYTRHGQPAHTLEQGIAVEGIRCRSQQASGTLGRAGQGRSIHKQTQAQGPAGYSRLLHGRTCSPALVQAGKAPCALPVDVGPCKSKTTCHTVEDAGGLSLQ